MTRHAYRQRESWDQAVTEVRARLGRIDRGEAWAPAQMVRCLRVFVEAERHSASARLGGAPGHVLGPSVSVGTPSPDRIAGDRRA